MYFFVDQTSKKKKKKVNLHSAILLKHVFDEVVAKYIIFKFHFRVISYNIFIITKKNCHDNNYVVVFFFFFFAYIRTWTKEKMLSLLKWTQGEDKGTYTVGIPIEWIKRFNIDDFRNEKYDPQKEFAVEWRDQKKEPCGGWNCFLAQVIHVSG